jgi:pimeloyl-ACP methyl ester carboxylesterase
MLITRSNESHPNIFPTPEDFFPNSPFVKFSWLKGVGHFVHLEAAAEVIDSLKELLNIRAK